MNLTIVMFSFIQKLQYSRPVGLSIIYEMFLLLVLLP
jgi:hypothetical protein